MTVHGPSEHSFLVSGNVAEAASVPVAGHQPNSLLGRTMPGALGLGVRGDAERFESLTDALRGRDGERDLGQGQGRLAFSSATCYTQTRDLRTCGPRLARIHHVAILRQKQNSFWCSGEAQSLSIAAHSCLIIPVIAFHQVRHETKR